MIRSKLIALLASLDSPWPVHERSSKSQDRFPAAMGSEAQLVEGARLLSNGHQISPVIPAKWGNRRVEDLCLQNPPFPVAFLIPKAAGRWCWAVLPACNLGGA